MIGNTILRLFDENPNFFQYNIDNYKGPLTRYLKIKLHSVIDYPIFGYWMHV